MANNSLNNQTASNSVLTIFGLFILLVLWWFALGPDDERAAHISGADHNSSVAETEE